MPLDGGVIPRNGKAGAARRDVARSRPFVKLVKWRTGAEARISCPKRDHGWRRSLNDAGRGQAIAQPQEQPVSVQPQLHPEASVQPHPQRHPVAASLPAAVVAVDPVSAGPQQPQLHVWCSWRMSSSVFIRLFLLGTETTATLGLEPKLKVKPAN